MIPKDKAQQKIDLIKEYLEPTGLTIKELMDRNAYVPLLQLLDAYYYEMNKTQNSIQRQFNEKGNQLDQVYGAIKEPSNNDEMETIAQKDFPFEVMDKESRLIYHETVNSFWSKSEYDLDGNKTYYANSNGYVEGWQYDSDGNVTYNWNNEGVIRDNRPAETIIINGIKYKRID